MLYGFPGMCNPTGSTICGDAKQAGQARTIGSAMGSVLQQIHPDKGMSLCLCFWPLTLCCALLWGAALQVRANQAKPQKMKCRTPYLIKHLGETFALWAWLGFPSLPLPAVEKPFGATVCLSHLQMSSVSSTERLTRLLAEKKNH